MLYKHISIIIVILLLIFNVQTLCYAKLTVTAVTVFPPDNYQHRALVLMANRVKELTHNEVEIQVTVAGTLGFKGPELLQAVSEGQVDIAEIVTSNIAINAPILSLRTLPMLIDTWEDIKLFDDLARPYYETLTKKFGQQLLLISPWPFTGLWASSKVECLEDLKHLKIRAYDHNGTVFAAAVGAKGINIAFADTYPALATGLINAVLVSSISACEGNFYEVCRYHMPIRVSSASSFFTIHKKSWDKLTESQQQALQIAVSECNDFLWEEVKRVVEEKNTFAYEHGVTLVPISKTFYQQLKTVSQQIIGNWLKRHTKDIEAIALYNTFIQKKHTKPL